MILNLAKRADPTCPACGGTGVIEGRVWGVNSVAYVRDPDRICDCVPPLIIRAEEA